MTPEPRDPERDPIPGAYSPPPGVKSAPDGVSAAAPRRARGGALAAAAVLAASAGLAYTARHSIPPAAPAPQVVRVEPAPSAATQEAGVTLAEWDMAVVCPEGNTAGFCLRPSLFVPDEAAGAGDEVVFVHVSNAPWLLIDGLEDVTVDGQTTRVPARLVGGGQPGFRAVVRVPGRAVPHVVTFTTRYKVSGRAEAVTRTTAHYDGRSMSWRAESALDAVDVPMTGGRVYKVADWRR